MVECMRPGSVIVDLAAEQGGNCARTEAGKDIEIGGVKIIGRLNLASEAATDASRMYSRNLEKVIEHFLDGERLRFDLGDEITRRCLVIHGGERMADEPRQTQAEAG
jgi:NAD(P) transhydrogenase subunit alpha